MDVSSALEPTVVCSNKTECNEKLYTKEYGMDYTRWTVNNFMLWKQGQNVVSQEAMLNEILDSTSHAVLSLYLELPMSHSIKQTLSIVYFLAFSASWRTKIRCSYLSQLGRNHTCGAAAQKGGILIATVGTTGAAAGSCYSSGSCPGYSSDMSDPIPATSHHMLIE